MIPVDGSNVVVSGGDLGTPSSSSSPTLRRRRGGGASGSDGRNDGGGGGEMIAEHDAGSRAAAAELLPDVPVESVARLLRGGGGLKGVDRDEGGEGAERGDGSSAGALTSGGTASDDGDSRPQGRRKQQPRNDGAGVGPSENAGTTSSLSSSSGAPFLPGYPSPNYTAELSRIDRHFKIVSLGVIVAWLFLAILCYVLTPSDRIRRVNGLERTAALFAFALLLLTCLGRLLPLFYADSRSIQSGLLVCSLVVQGIALTTDALMAFAPTPVLIDPVVGTRVHLLRWCEWTPLAFAMTFMTEGIDVPREGNSLRMHYTNAFCQGLSTFMGLLFPISPNAGVWWVAMVASIVLFLFIFPRLWQKRAAFLGAERGTSVDEVELYDRVRLSYQLLSTCCAVWSLLVLMYFVAAMGPTFAPEGSFLRNPALTMVTEASMDVITKSLFMGIIVDVHDLVFNDAARAERRLEELRQMMSVVWESSSDVIVISVRGITGAITTMLSPTYLRMYQGKKGGKGMRSEDQNGSGNNGASEDDDGGCMSKGAKAVIFDLEASEFDPPDDGLSDTGSSVAVGEDCRGSVRLSSRGIYDECVSPSIKTKCKKRTIQPKMVHGVEFTGLSSFRTSVGGGGSGDERGGSADEGKKNGVRRSRIVQRYSLASNEEISSMADLVVNAWKCRGEHTVLMHDLVRLHVESNEDGDGDGDGDAIKYSTVRCEATVNRLEENAVVIVMRDISERFKRFEAEKRVISETTARMKDAEANRFTRHEVKNGLLAAIGLCDSLKETLSGPQPEGGGATVRGSSSSSAAVLAATAATAADEEGVVLDQLAATDAARCIVELDKTLNEILDTVLSEAMARDVIHEAYEPKMERVDILSLLTSMHCDGAKRFPIISDPNPLPLLMFDQQLLKYIHRNAVSNACKYGKKGGVVTTMIRFDEDSGELDMDVLNLPGDHHKEILELGDRARDAVFSPGKRLHRSFHGDFDENVLVSHSSGDGAWIMQKCAHTLGGECDIQFDKRRTVFNFRCPATAYDKAIKSNANLDDPTDFQVPAGSWGIAIDDSKIQRTLLSRFLRIAGVEEDRAIVLGRGRSEIEGFDDMVVQLIDQHPNEYFLLIVDENLDIVEDQTCHETISGSLLIENIRHRLLPDQERRLLALVRSANDSSHDVAIYNSRAHGFVPKAPVQRDHVLELLAPLWQKRHMYKPSVNGLLVDGSRDGSRDGSDGSAIQLGSLSDEDAEVRTEIMGTLDAIERLSSSCSETELKERWRVIWEKLHGLKGDVSTTFESHLVQQMVNKINALRGPTLPQDFASKWAEVQALVRLILSER